MKIINYEVFAKPSEARSEASERAKDAILSSIAASATEDPPCGNLPAMLRIALQAGPQGFLAKEGKKFHPVDFHNHVWGKNGKILCLFFTRAVFFIGPDEIL